MLKKKLRKYKYNKKRIFLFLFLVTIILSINLGYSFLSVTIQSRGVAEINATTWDVHFTNLIVDSSSVKAITPATISPTDPTSINFTAQLNEPGDSYAFTMDVVNEGTINAIIDSVEITPDISDKKYLTYTIQYDDGTAIAENDILNSEETKTIKVVMRFEEREDNAEYPSELTSLNMKININYIQNTN